MHTTAGPSHAKGWTQEWAKGESAPLRLKPWLMCLAWAPARYAASASTTAALKGPGCARGRVLNAAKQCTSGTHRQYAAVRLTCPEPGQVVEAEEVPDGRQYTQQHCRQAGGAAKV